MAEKDDILEEQYGPRQAQDQQRHHYVEMRPEDKQTITETYAPKWGRYIPNAARAFLLQAPQALMAVSPRAAPLPPASAAAGPLVPSIKVNGQVYTRGPTHSQALEAYAETLGKPAWEVDLTKGVIDGFTTPDGRFMNRLQAAKYVGVPTRTDYAKYGLESERGRQLGVVKADGGGLIEDAYGPNTGSTAEFLTQYEHSNPLEPYNAARTVADTHKQEGAWGVAKRIANAWAQGGAGLIGSMIKTPLYDAPKEILENYRPGAENEVVNQDIGKHAFDAGSTIMGGSVAPRPAGSLGTFAGERAMTADLAALEKAKEMQARGFGRDSIWQETGWGQWGSPPNGPPAPWRWEIDDSGAQYHPGRFEQKTVEARRHLEPRDARDQIRAQGLHGITEDVWTHPDLYEAYPELATAPWAALPPEQLALGKNFAGVWRGMEKGSEINNRYSPMLTQGELTTAHEVAGHGVQDIEGFPRGANPQMYSRTPEEIALIEKQWKTITDAQLLQEVAQRRGITMDDAVKAVQAELEAGGGTLSGPARRWADKGNPELLESESQRLRTVIDRAADPDKAYRLTDGEVDARNLEKRLKMDRLQRKQTPPWKTQDVPDEQIIRSPYRPPWDADGSISTADILEQNYALPMDEASKAARGKEMGIDMDRTWYRGSALPPQESLKPGTQGHHFGDDPDALFFSSSPEVASEYARSHALYNGMDRHQAEYAAAKAAHDARPRTPIRDFFYGRKPFRHDGTTDFYEGANVAPVHVAPGRQGVIDAGIGRAPDGGNEHINIRAELKKMKAQGYDTVLVRNSADVSGPASRNGYPDELVVFPKDGEYRGIRSPTADFDPAKASSPNLLAAGGNRKAAAGVAAKDILEQYGAGAPQFDLGRGRGEHVVRTDNGSISYTPPIGDEVIITNIATNEGARGQGHAGRLLDGFLAQADQAGLKVTLEAGATQRGGLRNRDLVDFYQSRGFQLVDPQTNLMTREPAAGVAAGLMKPTLTAGGNRKAAAGVAAKDILEQYGTGAKAIPPELEGLAAQALKFKDPKEFMAKTSTIGDEMKGLDKLAFGVTDGQELMVDPKKLYIKHKGDLENAKAEKQIPYGDDAPPADVSLQKIGGKVRWVVEDGHHRYWAAKRDGKPLKVRIDSIQTNPFEPLGYKGYDDFMEAFYGQAHGTKP